MLSCKDISFKIKDKIIINNLSFDLKPKEHLLILGDSGSGKTTLLCILAGLQQPSSGTVKYDDTDIYKLNQEKRDNFRGLNLGVIFQNFHLIKSLSLYQNIILANSFIGKKIDEQKILSYLENLNLKDKINQKASSLSIGEAQRLAVIRSFINEPKWILCDEPTSALDDNNTENMLKLLKEEAEKSKSSLIMVTHDQRVKSHFKNNILKI